LFDTFRSVDIIRPGDESISEWDVPKIDKDIGNNNDMKNLSRKSYTPVYVSGFFHHCYSRNWRSGLL